MSGAEPPQFGGKWRYLMIMLIGFLAMLLIYGATTGRLNP